jgi:hypothetical protein
MVLGPVDTHGHISVVFKILHALKCGFFFFFDWRSEG